MNRHFGGFMKKTLETIPFLLLITLIGHYLLSPDSFGVQGSFVTLGVIALCGYRLFALEQEKPDYVELFKEEFEKYKERRDKELIEVVQKQERAINVINEQVKEVNSNYGKMTVGMGSKKMDNFEF